MAALLIFALVWLKLPPEQRQAMMNSGQFQTQFSPQERGILTNLLAVEPYQPAHGAGLDNGVQYGHQ